MERDEIAFRVIEPPYGRIFAAVLWFLFLVTVLQNPAVRNQWMWGAAAMVTVTLVLSHRRLNPGRATLRIDRLGVTVLGSTRERLEVQLPWSAIEALYVGRTARSVNSLRVLVRTDALPVNEQVEARAIREFALNRVRLRPDYVVLEANYGLRRLDTVIDAIRPLVPAGKNLVRADRTLPAREWLPAHVLE